MRDYEEGDENGIVELLAHNWKHLKGVERLRYWDWEYRGAPTQAIVKVAVHEGRIVGHYSFLPLIMECGHLTVPGGKAEGGIVHPDYRGVDGLRLLPEGERRTIYDILITETFKTAQKRGLRLLWGFPNKLALKGQVKAGYAHMVTPISSFVLPLDIRKTTRILISHVSRTIGLKGIATFSPERMIGMLTAAKPAGISEEEMGRITIVEGINEIDRLWRAFAGENDFITIQKNPGYLKWRMRDNPILPHKILTAMRQGNPTAYVAFTVVRGRETIEGKIADMMALRGHEHDLRLLLRHAIHSIREERAHLITTWMTRNRHSTIYEKVLSDTGFIDLPVQSLDVLVRGYDLPEDFITKPGNWLITMAFTEGVS